MKTQPIVREIEMLIMGERCRIQVYGRSNGTFYALTRFSETDAIISDGPTIDAVLARHAGTLPMAIHSRRLKQRALLEGLKVTYLRDG